MTAANAGENGKVHRLAARLVALDGVAPDPVAHLIFRSTRRPDGSLVEGYYLPGETAPVDNAALQGWLVRNRGPDRLAVAVLSIREVLGPDGLLLQCTIDRRRGSSNGPFCGDPARVEFAGAAVAVRLYRSRPDGRLFEVVPSAESIASRVRAPEHFVEDYAAVKAHVGADARILDAREPTLFEDMIGLSSIIHVATPEGRALGCGVGWHGDMSFVLQADFPRFASELELLPEDTAAVDAAAQANDLVVGETRFDQNGFAVIARRKESDSLFLLRPVSGRVHVEEYKVSRDAASADQRRWMQYAEGYEGVTVLDLWRDGSSNDLLVLARDANGQVWRHHIDADGVETSREVANDTLIGALHLQRLEPRNQRDASPGEMSAVADAISAPEGSLLAYIQRYDRIMSALRAAREAISNAPNTGELAAALDDIGAHVAAASAHDLRDLERGELLQIENRMRVELSLMGCVILPPRARRMHNDEAPFGPDVAKLFPKAGHDIREAASCLALRRPTAAVFHCMRIVQLGIAELMPLLGRENPLATADRDWNSVLSFVREAASGRFSDVVNALDGVRSRWGWPSLETAEKYTEEEAELIFGAVARFMRDLAKAVHDYHQHPVWQEGAEHETVPYGATRSLTKIVKTT